MNTLLPIGLASLGLLALLWGGGRFVGRVQRVANAGSTISATTTAVISMTFAAAGLALAGVEARWTVAAIAALPLLGRGTVLMRTPSAECRWAASSSPSAIPFIPFSTLRPDGTIFETHELAGQRVLLKFFRGHWCPFCSAELRAFDAMADDLAAHGVKVIALSKDRPDQARYHAQRDGLRLQLLCDPS